MLEQFEVLACNMQVSPKPVVKGSLVKRRRNMLLVKRMYSTPELVFHLFCSITILFIIFGG